MNYADFWAADPKGTMSYRTLGQFPYVPKSVPAGGASDPQKGLRVSQRASEVPNGASWDSKRSQGA